MAYALTASPSSNEDICLVVGFASNLLLIKTYGSIPEGINAVHLAACGFPMMFTAAHAVEPCLRPKEERKRS